VLREAGRRDAGPSVGSGRPTARALGAGERLDGLPVQTPGAHQAMAGTPLLGFCDSGGDDSSGVVVVDQVQMHITFVLRVGGGESPHPEVRGSPKEPFATKMEMC